MLLVISAAFHAIMFQRYHTGCKFSIFLSFKCRRNMKKDIDWLIICKNIMKIGRD